jgi:Tol biopolymer transport system component
MGSTRHSARLSPVVGILFSICICLYAPLELEAQPRNIPRTRELNKILMLKGIERYIAPLQALGDGKTALIFGRFNQKGQIFHNFALYNSETNSGERIVAYENIVSEYIRITPDGRYILFEAELIANSPTLPLFPTVPLNAQATKSLFLLDRTTNQVETVLQTDDGNSFFSHFNGFDISPDGQQIVFSAIHTEHQSNPCFNGRICSVDLSSKQITLIGVDRFSLAPKYSTDAQTITYASNNSGHAYALHQYSLNSMQSKTIVEYSPSTAASQQNEVSGKKLAYQYPAHSIFSVSETGRYVAFTTSLNLLSQDSNTARDVYLYDSLSEETVLVSKRPDGLQSGKSSFAPEISPDGRFVFFINYLQDSSEHKGAENWTEAFRYDRSDASVQRVSINPFGYALYHHFIDRILPIGNEGAALYRSSASESVNGSITSYRTSLIDTIYDPVFETHHLSDVPQLMVEMLAFKQPIIDKRKFRLSHMPLLTCSIKLAGQPVAQVPVSYFEHMPWLESAPVQLSTSTAELLAKQNDLTNAAGVGSYRMTGYGRGMRVSCAAFNYISQESAIIKPIRRRRR